MRITREAIELLIDACDELSSAGQEWLDITDDSQMDTEERQEAREELEERLEDVKGILLTKKEKAQDKLSQEAIAAQVERDIAAPR